MNIQTKSYLIILLTFSLGIILGAIGCFGILHQSMGFAMGTGGPAHLPFGPPPNPSRMVEAHVIKMVDPTEDQRRQLTPVFDRFRIRFEAHMEQNRLNRDSSMAILDTDLASVLTPEQMLKWRARRPPMEPPPMENPPMPIPIESEYPKKEVTNH